MGGGLAPIHSVRRPSSYRTRLLICSDATGRQLQPRNGGKTGATTREITAGPQPTSHEALGICGIYAPLSYNNHYVIWNQARIPSKIRENLDLVAVLARGTPLPPTRAAFCRGPHSAISLNFMVDCAISVRYGIFTQHRREKCQSVLA